MDDQFFDLKGKRELAKISQDDMAERLGVTQSMVSRYEAEPENVAGGIIKKWNQICGDISNSKGIEIEDPRTELVDRITLIKNYIGTESLPSPDFAKDRIPVTPLDLFSGVVNTSKKPRVGVFGKFDAGKSRLLNTLLGDNRLPTGYQPATSVVCLIRHANEKPSWMVEDVWVFKKGFDLDLASDHDHCAKYKLAAGGYEALKQYGTHTGSSSSSEAYAAVVYIDSPLLLAADLIDLPGYGNKESDDERAEVGKKLVDAIIYLSTAQGFMDGFEISYFGTVLGTLPVYDFSDNPSDVLRNVFVVATQAHSVDSSQRQAIINGAANRSGKHLSSFLQQRYSDALEGKDVEVSEEAVLNDFKQRFFTFSADDAAIRDAFIKDLTHFVVNVYSPFTLNQVQQYIKLSKNKASEAFASWCDELTHAIEKREQAQAEVERIEAGENDRKMKRDLHINKINSIIDKSASASQLDITSAFNTHDQVDAIESVIRHRYDDKKEAQQLAHSFILNTIQTDINNSVKVRANELSEEVDEFLKNFSPSINKEDMQSMGWGFNARVVFMSALSGIGTVGALAAWAAIAAAGSNLGGYILIGQIVGWLSSIGISLGGSAAVMSFVSAIGGPITLAIAAGVLVALSAINIFGDSWQTKLAKKIHSEIAKQDVKEQISKGIAKFWSDTKTAFDIATKKTEEEYQKKLSSLKTIAFDVSPEALKRELAYAEELRSFFGGIPWRTIQK